MPAEFQKAVDRTLNHAKFATPINGRKRKKEDDPGSQGEDCKPYCEHGHRHGETRVIFELYNDKTNFGYREEREEMTEQVTETTFSRTRVVKRGACSRQDSDSSENF